MKITTTSLSILAVLFVTCQTIKDDARIRQAQADINLNTGEIALCGSGSFGDVQFGLSCKETVQADFNLATALLHSFEYAEAEKVFAKVIDKDPQCVMGYWGVAMSNFHPLWAPPTKEELAKGSKAIAIARTLDKEQDREQKYLEAVATIFDNWEQLDHKTRVLKFEKAAEMIYKEFPADKEAMVFYALALRAAADPADKTFAKQKQAGDILSKAFASEPNHPGIAHYLIHTYDYPELAELGLPAARKYASIAAASAHAQHMPSHIFTRLGLWDESIASNTKSMDAAKCYAEKLGRSGHWDQELHGLDYIVYAYLQEGKDDLAQEQVKYLLSMDSVFPTTFVNAYSFASAPARFAVERKDWKQAAALELTPTSFPWENFPWERSNIFFGKMLGAVHLKQKAAAQTALEELRKNYQQLVDKNKSYEARQVKIQVLTAEAWVKLLERKNDEAVTRMTEAAEFEEATEKHPVTPGELAPARELLGDLFMELKQYDKALASYESSLQRHPGRFNGTYGCAVAARQSGDIQKARTYFQQLVALTASSPGERPEISTAKDFLAKNIAAR
jgi:tetratricopeptide (TPR) repeat protein